MNKFLLMLLLSFLSSQAYSQEINLTIGGNYFGGKQGGYEQGIQADFGFTTPLVEFPNNTMVYLNPSIGVMSVYDPVTDQRGEIQGFTFINQVGYRINDRFDAGLSFGFLFPVQAPLQRDLERNMGFIGINGGINLFKIDTGVTDVWFSIDGSASMSNERYLLYRGSLGVTAIFHELEKE